MKKSDQYQLAMLTIISSELEDDIKIEIIETLLTDRNIAKFSECKKENAE